MNAHTYNSVKIFLLVPNLVCYVRIFLLMLFAVLIILDHPLLGILALIFAALSELLDAVDGFFARKLNQMSRLGTILDYTLDRVTLACGLCAVIFYYPQYWLISCFALALDMSSHFFHLYLTHLQGDKSHKTVTNRMPKLLRWYYGNRLVLFFSCLLHEFFIVFVLASYFYPKIIWIKLIACLLFPAFIFKTIIHLVQLGTALVRIAEIDAIEKNGIDIN